MSGPRHDLTPEQHYGIEPEQLDDSSGMYVCPACDDGPQYIVNVLEGAPSMMGYGFDPSVLDLGCGHRISWSPLDGSEHVELTPEPKR